MNKAIEVRNLTVEKLILQNVSVSVKKGEILALVGESGSGKTTLCKAIADILPRDIGKSGEIIKSGKVAMVFQNPMTALNPTIKVGKQILETILVNRNIPKREAKEIVFELIRKVGFEEEQFIYNQYPFEMSGGMQQRIVIAIALAMEADIILADEPTTALDVTIQKGILDLFKNLRDERKVTILFITHDLKVAAYLADSIAIIKAGKIQEINKNKDIFNNPRSEYTKALINIMKDRLV